LRSTVILRITRYSLSKSAPPLGKSQGRGAIPRDTTLIGHEWWPSLPILWIKAREIPRSVSSNIARPDNGGVSEAAYSRPRGCGFPHPSVHIRCSTPQPIRRRRGCLARTIGGSLNPGLPVTIPVRSHSLSIDGEYAIGIRRCQTAGKRLSSSPKIDMAGHDARIFPMPTSFRLSPNRARFCIPSGTLIALCRLWVLAHRHTGADVI
jgi:hypothetical protein